MTEEQRMAYEQMLNELEAHMLVTVLVPSKRSDRRESDMIRCNISVPPTWFRRMCARYPSSRGIRRGKFDSKLRRANVLSLLRGLATGRPVRSKYLADLAGIAEGVK
jgi:hypothetical protein